MPVALVAGLGLLVLATVVAAVVELVVKRRRQDRERHLRPGGFRRWVESVREDARIHVTGLTDRQTRRRQASERLKKLRDEIREALNKGRFKHVAWLTAGAVVLTGIWVLAVTAEIGIDARSFEGLGYQSGMAYSLATLTTLVFCVLGIVLSDLIGLTHLLPSAGPSTLTARVLLIGAVSLVLVAAASQLPRLAQYRSAAIATEVEVDQNAVQALSQLPASVRPAIVVQQAQKKLAEAKSKLATAQYVDTRLAIGAALLEAATSWAAMWSLILIACLGVGLLSSALSWRADAAGAAIRQTNQQFFARVTRRAEELEIDPSEVDAVLRESQGTVAPQENRAEATGGQTEPPPAPQPEAPAPAPEVPAPAPEVPAPAPTSAAPTPPSTNGASAAEPQSDAETEAVEPASWTAF